MTFTARVTDQGHLLIDNHAGFKAAMVSRFRGREVVVRVTKKPKPQGSQQMRYYRGVVVPDIADACGYSDPAERQQVHEGLAWKFLRLPDGPFGAPRRRSTSPTDMSEDDMRQYLDNVIVYAETSIPGCRIRRPHEVDLDQIHEESWT